MLPVGKQWPVTVGEHQHENAEVLFLCLHLKDPRCQFQSAAVREHYPKQDLQKHTTNVILKFLILQICAKLEDSDIVLPTAVTSSRVSSCSWPNNTLFLFYFVPQHIFSCHSRSVRQYYPPNNISSNCFPEYSSAGLSKAWAYFLDCNSRTNSLPSRASFP